jgi:catalase
MVEVIAPAVGGVTLTDGRLVPADQKLGGGPSVLYDAVAVVVDESGAAMLAEHPAAKDFVTDAHAHHKFCGYSAAARALLNAVGLAGERDGGVVPIASADDASSFIETCRRLRAWPDDAIRGPAPLTASARTG